MKKSFIYILVFIISLISTDQLTGRFLLEGINRFYGLNQHSDILIIGHSHLMLATNKDAMESKINQISGFPLKENGYKVSKYTREGVGVIDRMAMVKQYLDSPYSDSLKVVLYGVDLFTFAPEGLSSNSYKLFYPFMETGNIDAFVKSNASNPRDYYIHKIFQTTRYSDALINASFRGWLNDFSNYKFGTLDAVELKKEVDAGKSHFVRKIEMNPTLVAEFEKTMDLLAEKNIRIVLVNTPVVDIINNYDTPGYNRVINYYKKYAETHSNVEYWDFNPEYSSRYSIFYDPIHLNPEGQEVITSEIIKRINSTNDGTF